MWRDSPDIQVLIRKKQRQTEPFKLEGTILDIEDRLRVLSQGGSNQHVTIPTRWIEQHELTGPFQLTLFETFSKGIILQEVKEVQKT